MQDCSSSAAICSAEKGNCYYVLTGRVSQQKQGLLLYVEIVLVPSRTQTFTIPRFVHAC